MKNKKYIFIGILIVILLIIAIIIFNINNNKNYENNNENSLNELTENIQSDNYESTQQLITIKSTKENPIEKDNVEVTNIEILDNYGDLKLNITLKNNSKELLNGFYIVIDLLDKDGNKITWITENSKEKIEADNEFTFTYSIMELPNSKDIVNAKINDLEKNSAVEDEFDKLEEQVMNIIT